MKERGKDFGKKKNYNTDNENNSDFGCSGFFDFFNGSSCDYGNNFRSKNEYCS